MQKHDIITKERIFKKKFVGIKPQLKLKKKKDSFKCVSYVLSTERLNLQQFNIHCKVFK